jgi:hypothetical protein
MMAAVDDAAPAPPGLLDRLRADPARAPEQLALAAGERHGPWAVRWAEELRGRYAFTPAELAARATRSHAALARTSGAVTGLGGAVGVVPDLAGLAWLQSRLVFCVAAAHGFDPLDRMRPAELLVLWEVYADPVRAREALDGAGQHLAVAYAQGRMSGGDASLAGRLARMVAEHGAKRFAGRLIPGFASIVNAVGNERATRRLGERAQAFYGG